VGRSGRATSPIGLSESNQARWQADLLVKAAGRGRASAAGRETHLVVIRPGQTG
jgi:hypothetical protein